MFLDWLKKLLTSSDNTTPSMARHVTFGGFILLAVSSATQAFKGVAVDFEALARSFAFLAAGGGVGAMTEHSSQPQPDKTTVAADNKGNVVAETTTEGSS